MLSLEFHRTYSAISEICDEPPRRCAHTGVLNILDHVRKKMELQKLRAILGGTHLMFYGPGDLSRAMDEFERFSIEQVGVSHCTGFEESVELSNRFGDRFSAASAGKVFNF